MIRYEDIYAFNQAHRCLRNRRRWWGDTEQDRSQAQLTLFTVTKTAPADSQHNLEHLLARARKHDVDILVFCGSKIQMLGTAARQAMKDSFNDKWIAQFDQWMDITHGVEISQDAGEVGECATLHVWRQCFTDPDHAGVYEVKTGRRMTSRRGIIERFWHWGFPALRGRPLTVGRPRWSGNKEELIELADLYYQHHERRYASEMAKKICSAYTSISRGYAWPGNW